MNIPKQLHNPDIRFVLLGRWDDTVKDKNNKPKHKGKAPFESKWQTNGYSYTDKKLLNHKNNFGVIGGYGRVRILDIDDKELGEEFEKKVDTYTVKTGSGGRHFYFYSDYEKNHVLVNELGELRAKNYQVVSAPCRHPNGNYYEVINEKDIQEISSEDLLKLIEPYLRKETTPNNTNDTEPKEKDTSNSGLEYRKIIALLREGKSREEIYKIMTAYSKWSGAPEQYRTRTFEKAELFVLIEKEKERGPIETKITPETKEILEDKNIFKRITGEEFDKEITKEYSSRKAIFLSLCSIWVKDVEVPINTMVSSDSSSGKSFVCKRVIKIFPKHLVEMRSKITGETFTYWHTNEDSWDWDGKICYLEDISQNLLDSPTFKVMCSDGSVATVVRNQKAVDLIVKGKPCILVTTATTNPTTEVINRFNIVPLDETESQTEEITRGQATGKKKVKYDKKVVEALGILKRVNVTIPYGLKIHEYITKHYGWKDVRLRRDFSRLMDLVRCSTALYQFQRDKNEEGELIATEQDYEIARECINYIQTTTLKGLTHKLKRAYESCVTEKEFTAKDIHSKYPFVNQTMWYRYLDELCERKMLTTELRDIPESKKRVTYFLVPKRTSFNLPTYKELCEISITDTTDINDINDVIDTNDNNKCMKYINYTENPTPQKPNFDNDEDFGGVLE